MYGLSVTSMILTEGPTGLKSWRKSIFSVKEMDFFVAFGNRTKIGSEQIELRLPRPELLPVVVVDVQIVQLNGNS